MLAVMQLLFTENGKCWNKILSDTNENSLHCAPLSTMYS